MQYLQLVCNVAGGVLEQLQETQRHQVMIARMKECVDVNVAINEAKTLPELEQRVKHLLGNFFSVYTVRVLFYDEKTDELLISSAQMKQKGVSRIGLDKGVVGLCAKRQAIVHVANISHHPYMDTYADGLLRGGRPVGADAAMLVGPLVVEYVEGNRLLGIVQLLERKKNDGSKASSEFSAEEQNLFSHILRVLACVVWRTYQVQEISNEPSAGGSSRKAGGLEALLAG